MGMWDFGPFDNDTAADWIIDEKTPSLPAMVDKLEGFCRRSDAAGPRLSAFCADLVLATAELVL